jgi:GxxExxY protein
MTTRLILKELTYEIIGAFYTVYNELGYGFLESVYVNALSLELRLRGLTVEREKLVEIHYLGQPVGQFRMDLVVNSAVLIETKSCKQIGETERRQLLNYLKATPLKVGLLFHFGPTPQYERFVSPHLIKAM